jgi:hypothetical protein
MDVDVPVRLRDCCLTGYFVGILGLGRFDWSDWRKELESGTWNPHKRRETPWKVRH